MKLAVIYDSKTNNTAAVAGYMTEGMNSLEGVEAKAFHFSEIYGKRFATQAQKIS